MTFKFISTNIDRIRTDMLPVFRGWSTTYFNKSPCRLKWFSPVDLPASQEGGRKELFRACNQFHFKLFSNTYSCAVSLLQIPFPGFQKPHFVAHCRIEIHPIQPSFTCDKHGLKESQGNLQTCISGISRNAGRVFLRKRGKSALGFKISWFHPFHLYFVWLRFALDVAIPHPCFPHTSTLW